jgi:hypothetical protein
MNSREMLVEINFQSVKRFKFSVACERSVHLSRTGSQINEVFNAFPIKSAYSCEVCSIKSKCRNPMNVKSDVRLKLPLNMKFGA